MSDIEKEIHFKTCAFNTCLTLENGELAYCSRATNAWRIQHFERLYSDYLKVSKRKGFQRELEEYIRNPHPMEACRYCNGSVDGDEIKAAVQL